MSRHGKSTFSIPKSVKSAQTPYQLEDKIDDMALEMCVTQEDNYVDVDKFEKYSQALKRAYSRRTTRSQFHTNVSGSTTPCNE